MDEPVEIVTTAPRTVAVACFHCPAEAIPGRIGEAFMTVGMFLGQSRQPIAGPAVALFRQRDGGFDVRAGFAAPTGITAGRGGVSIVELPAVEAARLEHIGPYQTLEGAYARMQQAVTDRGRRLDPDTPTWEEYWSPPDTPPASIRTVIYWPLLPA